MAARAEVDNTFERIAQGIMRMLRRMASLLRLRSGNFKHKMDVTPVDYCEKLEKFFEISNIRVRR